MIKITNLDKYYLKDQPNQIHVINNCTLELPETGLVSLLGPSGSGKTTLLNVIGGLDKADSGQINYGDTSFNKYDAKVIDSYRKDKIGYVFQNYLLFNNRTVYDNLREALIIIGVNDEKEQRKRIEYALGLVGLYKFRKKLVKNLSGGQMQRVSIARALIKDSKIIIADEPTGNIDSANTIEVMNILKEISKSTLVLLVTHEVAIANYYSDRIIQIQDGSIIGDGKVTSRMDLNYANDQKIHLLDYEKEEINAESLGIDLYKDETSSDAKIQLIIKNNTIYIKSDKKIVNLNDSSIALVEDHYENLKQDSNIDIDFDTSWYKNEEVKKQGFFKRLFSNIGRGFKSYFSGKKSFIAFMIIFIILGAVMAGCMINVIKFNSFDESVLYTENGYVITSNDNSYYNEVYPSTINMGIYGDAADDGIITSKSPINTEYLSISYYTNIIDSQSYIASAYSFSYDDSLELLAGTVPGPKQIVLGKKRADEIIDKFGFAKGDYKSLIGLSCGENYISGVTKKDTISVFVNKDAYNDMNYMGDYYSYDDTLNFSNYTYYKNNISLISGVEPTNDTDVIVNEKVLKDKFLEGNSFTYDNTVYNIVGTFRSDANVHTICFLTLNKKLTGATYTSWSEKYYSKSYYLSTYFYNLKDSEYTILEGNPISKSGEVLASINSGYSIGDKVKEEYTVVGLYGLSESYKTDKNAHRDELIICNFADCLRNQYESSFTFEVNDVRTAKEYFNSKGFKLVSLHDYQYNIYLKGQRKSQIISLVISLVLLLVVFVYTYLSARSRMINEIYNLGVYRCLGKSKKDIKKDVKYYAFAQTSVSSVAGYLLVVAGYLYLGLKFDGLFSKFTTKPAYLILGIFILYISNILISLIPYQVLLKKTPSEIISKYDI